MHPIHAIILAAGMSSRFGTEFNKLLVQLCGVPLVVRTIRSLEELQIPITVVVGYQREALIETITTHAEYPLSFAIQEIPRGTGHAVLCSRHHWDSNHILVLNGDMPLLSRDIINSLIAQHFTRQATVSFVTAIPDSTTHAYGRVLHTDAGVAIVEAKDFTGDTTIFYPINAGVYIFERAFLESAIDLLTTNNASKELYLTDLIAVASGQGKIVCTLEVPFDNIRGVNTIAEFAVAQSVERKKIVGYWMAHGVIFTMPDTVDIHTDVTIGRGTIIHAGVQLHGSTNIGSHCTIHPYAIIEDSALADSVVVKSHSVIDRAQIGAHVHVGPFAHIHTHTQLGEAVVIGNFVEVKQSVLDTKTKAKHLAYLGDATLGKQVNIGAGTIVCNYDGVQKHRTEINDNVFVGSNSTLVAPLTIGTGAYTAAGSTITEDVPADALAFGRARQVNKLLYAKSMRDKPVIPDQIPPSLHDAP
jgi:bifunctional UDP-N-acetylglucosamine pyrophosphorylase / glucosamine-1-phosphate N-acetyltransferase